MLGLESGSDRRMSGFAFAFYDVMIPGDFNSLLITFASLFRDFLEKLKIRKQEDSENVAGR